MAQLQQKHWSGYHRYEMYKVSIPQAVLPSCNIQHMMDSGKVKVSIPQAVLPSCNSGLTEDTAKNYLGSFNTASGITQLQPGCALSSFAGVLVCFNTASGITQLQPEIKAGVDDTVKTLVGFNTASGMAQLQPIQLHVAIILSYLFQYRRRYGPVATWKNCRKVHY